MKLKDNLVDINSSGTITSNGFQSVRYRDEYPSGGWVVASGAAAPDSVGYTIGGVGCNRYSFDGNATEERMTNNFEIPHDLAFDELNAETLFIEAHVHWRPSTNNTGTVEWFLDYCYCPVDGAPILQTSLSCIGTVNANEQYFHKITPFLNGSAQARIPKPTGGFKLGDIILFNIRRTPSGDSYGDDAILEQVALHVPTNDRGSRQIYIK